MEPQATFNSLVGDLDYPMFIVTACADGERAGCLIGFATQASIEPSRFLACLSHENRTYRVAIGAGCSRCTSSRRTPTAAHGGRAPAARRCSTAARTASSAACSSGWTPATTTRSCSRRCWPSRGTAADEFQFHRAKRIEPGHEA